MPTKRGCTFLEYSLVMSISRGVTASRARVNCQLTQKNMVRVATNITTLSTT